MSLLLRGRKRRSDWTRCDNCSPFPHTLLIDSLPQMPSDWVRFAQEEYRVLAAEEADEASQHDNSSDDGW